MTRIPQHVRIPRYALAAWARVHEKLRAELETSRLPGEEGPITEARITAAMIELCERALGVGSGVIFDPRTSGMYEAPPPDTESPDEPRDEMIDLKARIERLEREEFWRKLEKDPPPPGQVPILPDPSYVEEAKRRFPAIYGRHDEGGSGEDT